MKPQFTEPKQVSGGERYVCLNCRQDEEIPLNVVRDFDVMDDGDPEESPQFACGACGGGMYPQTYKSIHGYEYRLEERLGTRV